MNNYYLLSALSHICCISEMSVVHLSRQHINELQGFETPVSIRCRKHFRDIAINTFLWQADYAEIIR